MLTLFICSTAAASSLSIIRSCRFVYKYLQKYFTIPSTQLARIP